MRRRLDAGLADHGALLRARAEASELALRAAGALVAASGGPGILRGHTAERMAREALFTLVAASRAEVKAELLERLAV